jgi:type III secretion protein J
VLAAAAAAALLGGVGCAGVPVAAGLDDGDANQVVVTLTRANVDAQKEVDPASDGRFRVLVQRDETARAIQTLRDEGLPRSRTPGVLDAMDKGALVPSRAAEHAQLVAGLAGDLERTLESVDGVLHARVHLNVADPDPLRGALPPKATASVLIEHRGSAPPIAGTEVQRLVAGGVPALAAADVAVVLVPHSSPAAGDMVPLAHLGPIGVSRGSLRSLQFTLVGLVALVAFLAATTLVLYARLARLRGATAEAQARRGPA